MAPGCMLFCLRLQARIHKSGDLANPFGARRLSTRGYITLDHLDDLSLMRLDPRNVTPYRASALGMDTIRFPLLPKHPCGIDPVAPAIRHGFSKPIMPSSALSTCESEVGT